MSRSHRSPARAVLETAGQVAVSTAATAAASTVAYAGFGGTLLKAGVALGVCSPPLLMVAAPIVAGLAYRSIVARI
jgi:hypothetical protein